MALNQSKRQVDNKPDAVVITRFSALGDVALAIPAVYDLCVAYPRLNVVFVTRKRMEPLAVNPPDNLIVEGIDLSLYSGVGGMIKLGKELLNKYNIKCFVDLHDVLRTKILRNYMKFKGIKVSVIDKGRKEKQKLVRKGAEAYFAQGNEPLRTTVQRYRDTINQAGFSVPSLFKSLRKTSTVESGNTKRIGIAPFAAHQGKIYPLDRMEEVVNKLAADSANQLFLFGGGQKESDILERWAHGKPNVINMASRNQGLAKELDVMTTLHVMIAMDSANMHLAALAGVPRIVTIWGATHPAAGFAPFCSDPEPHSDSSSTKTNTTPQIICIETPMTCRPCSVYGNRPCRHGDYRCMTSISPQTVIDSVVNKQH